MVPMVPLIAFTSIYPDEPTISVACVGGCDSSEILTESRVALLALVVRGPGALRPAHIAAGALACFTGEGTALEAIRQRVAWSRKRVQHRLH